MEKISIEDLAGENIKCHPDDWKGIKVMEDEIVFFDSEKGYTESRCVIFRQSDSKYYSFTIENWGSGVVEYIDDVKEVFPKTKTITYYE